MTIAIPPIAAANAQAMLDMVLSSVGEWIATHETETTKREFIRAQERAALAEIHARRDLFLTYLDRSFDERRIIFDRLFDALDQALADDPAQIAAILGSITALAAKSPFADLSNIELVRERLQDPNHTWDV